MSSDHIGRKIDCHNCNDTCATCKCKCTDQENTTDLGSFLVESTFDETELEPPMFFYDPLDEYISRKLSKMELVNIRKGQHMTKVDMSKLTGLSAACISDIESLDSGNPTLKSISKYLNALGYEMAFQRRKI